MTDRFYLTTSYEDRTSETHSFDARDAKGRVIGCLVVRGAGEFTADKTREYQGYYVNQWLGPVFTACVEATRNGDRYGATQPTRNFRTEAEREAFIAKRVEASRKAAAKKAA